MSNAQSVVTKGGGRLGERLVDRGCITEDQLALALREQERTGGRIGGLLVRLGFTTDQEITASLATQAGVEQVDLSTTASTEEAVALLPESFCREHTLLPLSVDRGLLTIAMANTFDVLIVDRVSQMTGCPVKVLAATEPDLLASFDMAFGFDVQKSFETLIAEAVEVSHGKTSDEVRKIVGEQPVVRLVDSIIREAVRQGSTDVHIEPEARIVRVRNRVDGMLVAAVTLPTELRTAVAARIKILANLDIAENRLPQDGKISTEVDRRAVMIRVSTLPTIYGESVVMRILDRSKVVVGLEDLGFSGENLKALSTAIHRAAGIILVTGPTGSGKTTTLYAALKTINTMDRKIATLEDPVEYELPVVRQSQVNMATGFTFGLGLRSLLRQDPDVILVGEMRDAETVEVAMRAAMTGHLVLSTLHTNSAVGAIARLIDMGVESYLLGSTLVAVVAQRLVRLLCPDCRVVDEEPDPQMLRAIGISHDSGVTLFRSNGCESCSHTGYRGRRAVGEVLTVTRNIAREITKGAGAETISKVAHEEGMVGMLGEVCRMVMDGETSMKEALRQTWDTDRVTEVEEVEGAV